MTERDVREALAEALHDHIDGDFLLGGGGWGPDGWVDDIPLHGARISDVVRWATNALLASDALAQMLTEAEQRGREDNADHGMCYVHGSKALDARLAEARAEALREAAVAWQWGEWAVLTEPIKAGEQIQLILGAAQAVTDWLRDRAALTAEGDQ